MPLIEPHPNSDSENRSCVPHRTSSTLVDNIYATKLEPWPSGLELSLAPILYYPCHSSPFRVCKSLLPSSTRYNLQMSNSNPQFQQDLLAIKTPITETILFNLKSVESNRGHYLLWFVERTLRSSMGGRVDSGKALGLEFCRVYVRFCASWSWAAGHYTWTVSSLQIASSCSLCLVFDS